MKMRAVWSALVVTGCGSGGGVLEIDVTPAEGMTISTVELFVGIRDAHLEALRPANYSAPQRSVWWKRDRDPERDTQAANNERVTFAFQPGGAENALQALVAVAYDGQGTPVAIATRLAATPIPQQTEIHHYELQLAAFEPLPRTTASAAAGLQLWGTPGDPRACVHVDSVEGFDSFAGATSAMIATNADPDCDGFDDDDPLECAPRAFMGQKPRTRASLSCVLSEPSSTAGTELCVAGGPKCTDGIAFDETGCTPSSYCLPHGVCDSGCTGFGCDLPLATLTHIQCELPSRFVDSTNTVEMCASPTEIALQVPFPGVSCGEPALLRDALRPFATALTYGTNLTFSLTTSDASTCRFSISGAGTLPMNGTTPRTEFQALASVPLVAPVKGRGVALPVAIRTPNNGCTSAPYCKVVVAAYETLHACITTPVAAGAVID